MAIVQISRIQHRRGIKADLPQLSSAELGWSVDSRQLYIGNGTLEEGAPSIGNTEILTEYSDLLNVAETYTFSGNIIGYAVQTGVSASNPVTRTLQEKLDDFVNIRDFGAKGDGVNDDTAAINQALEQLYARDEAYTASMPRRSLYFPAGNYILSGNVMHIPSYATIVGDGMEHTIITQTDGSQECVAKLVDNKFQSGANIGQNGAIRPSYININGVTFKHNSVEHSLSRTFKVEYADTVFFKNVKFSGNVPSIATLTAGNGSACLSLEGSPATPTTNIFFDQCEFDNQTYGVVAASQGVSGILFSSSKFHNLHIGMSFGGNSPIDSIKVCSSSFDDIFGRAIDSYQCDNIVSSFNYYRTVGIRNGIPEEPVIAYSGKDCYSFGDMFERSDSDALISPRVQSTGTAAFIVIPHDSLRIGERKFGPGKLVTLNSGTTSITTLNSSMYGASIKYTVLRDSHIRTGTFTISQRNNVVHYADDYSETGTIDVTLSANISANVTTLWATVSNGSSVSFRYGIDSFLN